MASPHHQSDPRLDNAMSTPPPRPLTSPPPRVSSPARYYSQEFPSSFDIESAGTSPIEPPSYPNGPYAPVPSSRPGSTLLRYSRMPSAHTSYNDEKSYFQSDSDLPPEQQTSHGWSKRRKIIVGSIIAGIVLLALILGLGLGLGLHNAGSFDYTPSNATVTNETAFTEGGASRQNVWNVSDGIGAGKDEYTYYSGPSENFPAVSTWISFQNLWSGNYYTLKNGCKEVYNKKHNSDANIDEIYNAIQNRANASLVDHRLILAVVLQESAGCVRAESSVSYGGVSNKGLMQSHNGHSYSSSHSNTSILAMIQDGTQGTDDGWGYVHNLNTYGNAYRAARGYNSGLIPASGNLSEAAGATACYVSDIANRLTGWANGTRHCED